MSAENYVIHGLDHHARSLASLQGDQEKAAFLIGSQSLRFVNQVNLLEYEEDSSQISRKTYYHPAGEIWHISCSPNDRNVFATCYSAITNEKKCQPGCSLWSLNETKENLDAENPELIELARCESLSDFSGISCFYWQPISNSSSAFLTADNHILLTNAEDGLKIIRKIAVENRLTSKISHGRWNPHHNSNIIAAAIDCNVKGYDIRTDSKQTAFHIESCHLPIVRNLDFNPNRQYFLATCGDDCRIKFWDVRNSKSPVMSIEKHSHWVWSVRFNPVHDQLLLSCSSDARLILHSTTSISSESIFDVSENKSDNEDDSIESSKSKKDTEILGDGVIKIYEEHEDSVYCCEWSIADPWLFASLSYDGRVIINKVLRNIKYKVLQL